MSQKEGASGALIAVLIYGLIFASLWFAVLALVLGRGIVG